jgi:hypothetical protein
VRLDVGQLLRQTLGSQSGPVAVTASGGVIDINEEGLAADVAEGLAQAMASNIEHGMRPDGRGPMPGRKRDGRPRGIGAGILKSIHARRVGPMQFVIRAWRETPGQLGRILREVPFVPPPAGAIVSVATANNVNGGGR